MIATRARTVTAATERAVTEREPIRGIAESILYVLSLRHRDGLALARAVGRTYEGVRQTLMTLESNGLAVPIAPRHDACPTCGHHGRPAHRHGRTWYITEDGLIALDGAVA